MDGARLGEAAPCPDAWPFDDGASAAPKDARESRRFCVRKGDDEVVGAAELVEAEPSSLGARTEVDPPVSEGSRPRTPAEDCRRLGDSAGPGASPPT